MQAVLAARIDRLPPGDKALLQTASVIGKDVPFALLQAIAELAEDELHAAIGRLQAAEFLYEASLFPDLEYTFKHALTHDVAYGSLLQDRRRALHGRIVETIERLYPDRLAEHVERLAHHAFRGEVWEKAVTYLRQAGAKAFARSANREAVAYFEQALTALTPSPRDPRDAGAGHRCPLRPSERALPAGRIRTDRRVSPGSRNPGQRPGRSAAARMGVGLYERHLPASRAATPTEVRAFARASRGHRRDARRCPAPGRRPVLPCLCVLPVGRLSRDRRHLPETDAVARRASGPVSGSASRGFPRSCARAFLARALAERGVFDEADAHGHDAIRIAEALEHPFSLAWACLGLGVCPQRQGRAQPGRPLARTRGRAQCREWSITLFDPNAMASLGHVYARVGTRRRRASPG